MLNLKVIGCFTSMEDLLALISLPVFGEEEFGTEMEEEKKFVSKHVSANKSKSYKAVGAKDMLFVEDIYERENAATPAIIQENREALAFWVKDYIVYEVIERKERGYKERAFKRLLPNQNMGILGNTSLARHAILSFVMYWMKNSSLAPKEDLNLWK